jgi:hypothetical protein
MRKFVFGASGFIVGLVFGYVAVALLLLIAGEAFGISQAEGAYAMSVAFFWAPAGALVAGVLCMAWALRRARRSASPKSGPGD